MELKPLQEWICDTCGEVIKDAKDGWIEWLSDKNLKDYGFKIVHHKSKSPNPEGCYPYHNKIKEPAASVYLEKWVGVNGIVALLTFIDSGPNFDPNYKGPAVKDLREFIELFRRLQLPFYEEARIYWQEARKDNFFDDAAQTLTYLPSTLEALVKEYRK